MTKKNDAVLRAKLRVSEVLHRKDADGETSMEIVKLQAVYSTDENSENKQWSTWTPSASFEMQINNPNAFGKLSSGHEFYVDFIPCEQTEAKTAQA
jgi:hypothetical protein